jgi:hypothetical protein
MIRIRRWEFNIAALAIICLAMFVGGKIDDIPDMGPPGPLWWAIVVPTLVFLFSAEWFFFRRKPLIERSGYCTQCGYDLRATPDRCPECGKTVQKTI